MEILYIDELAKELDSLSFIKSKNQVVAILAKIFQSLDATSAKQVAYLLLGEVGPEFEGKRFAMAEKLVKNTIEFYLARFGSETISLFQQHLTKEGDLGDAFIATMIESGFQDNSQQNLTINTFFNEIYSLADTSGEGSVELKKQLIVELLEKLSNLGRKFLIKIITGNLRLGFSSQNLLAAFAALTEAPKASKPLLEYNYFVYPDIGRIIFLLKEFGLEVFKDPSPTLGIPIYPAAAERVVSLEELFARQDKFVIQPKLDGIRVQIHKFTNQQNETVVKIFSRNLLDLSEMFPEVVDSIKLHPDINFIVDGEVVGIDLKTGRTLPFQQTIKRRRKHSIQSLQEDIPLKVFLFDILFWETPLLKSPYFIRRQKLDNWVKGFVLEQKTVSMIEEYLVSQEISNAEKVKIIKFYFQEMINRGVEGLLVKKFDSIYHVGTRSFNWIKIKQIDQSRLGDTIDAIVLGYFYGQGRRASIGIGALLVGIFDKNLNQYQSLAKVGSGLSDSISKEIIGLLSLGELSCKPENYNVSTELTPDVWVKPSLVVEVDADEISISPNHSAAGGFALRFPRLKSIRRDKSFEQATSVDEIKQIFNSQNNA